MPSRVEQFEAFVAKQPDNDLYRFSLAQALLAEDRPLEAIPHLRTCISRKADWMMPRILLGRLLLGMGRRDEARPILEEALHLADIQHHEDPERELRELLDGL